MAGEGLELNDLSACCQYGTGSRRRKAMGADDKLFVELDIPDHANAFGAAADKANADTSIGGRWAHVTRKFRDAEEEAPSVAGQYEPMVWRSTLVAEMLMFSPDALVATGNV